MLTAWRGLYPTSNLRKFSACYMTSLSPFHPSLFPFLSFPWRCDKCGCFAVLMLMLMLPIKHYAEGSEY